MHPPDLPDVEAHCTRCEARLLWHSCGCWLDWTHKTRWCVGPAAELHQPNHGTQPTQCSHAAPPQEPDVPGHRPASRPEPAQTLSAGYSPIPGPTQPALAGLSVAQAYARGYQAGQCQLCPRCGVALEAEVAAERAETPPAERGYGCSLHGGSATAGEEWIDCDTATCGHPTAGEKAAYGQGRDDEAAGLDIPEEYR